MLNFHNSNSKPITYHSNSIVTQKFQHFCLVTKLSHVSHILTSLFAKMMDSPTDTTQKNMVATRVPFLFYSSNPATPKPSSTTTNGKSRNPQPQPPPPTALNTITTSTKKSKWIKNPNAPIALNQMCLIEEEKKKRKKKKHQVSSRYSHHHVKKKEKRKKKKQLREETRVKKKERKKRKKKREKKASGLITGGAFDPLSPIESLAKHQVSSAHLYLHLSISIFSLPSTHSHSPTPSTSTNPLPLAQPLATINHYKPIHHHKPSNHQQNPFINHRQNQNTYIKIKIKPINRTHQPSTKPIH